MKLSGLKPERVLYYFEELTKIPRGSGNEKAVSDYLAKVGNDLGLEVIQEECLNVIIKKQGVQGKENLPRVILQGHMDIVCAKNEDYEFDFDKDSIPLVVDGDYIKTEGTTLGADNGIAVAMALAVLESNDISHPPITGLFTVAEETGMDGVIGLKSENIEGDILINIDSEEEGAVLASCAGGVNSIVSLPIVWEKKKAERLEYTITIKGLLGGHSGIEINKNRASAIKLMGRVLAELDKTLEFELADITGGEKMNAIPKMSSATILISNESVNSVVEVIEAMQLAFSNEFKTADPQIKLAMDKTDNNETTFNQETKAAIINILRLLPQGVNSMSADIEGLVESSNNVGVLETKTDIIYINNALRSSVRTIKHEISDRIQLIAKAFGATATLEADYPEWEFKVKSEIRELMKMVYKEMTGETLKVEAIHAGLECGLLKEKVGDIDMISLGPNIYEVHTPGEKVSISSIERVYNFLIAVIERI